jgi:pyruvate dehydrogenase E1 component alpha subunit/2-oxoisovalerate dehydrogenase E1 component alpha subunit
MLDDQTSCPFVRVLSEDGRADPETDPCLPPERLQQVYREMLLLRRLDEKLVVLQRQGRIGAHSSAIGQEAVPVATALVSRRSDWVFPALREAGAMLVRGFPLRRYLAQVFGTHDDVQRGRQMPGHQSSREANHVSWSSCVGTQLSHAVGVSWAGRRRGDDLVAIAFLGDGAASSPDFHAALNFAAVLSVPCLFVCQNNQYAASTAFERQTAAASIAAKGRAYAVPAVRVDGNDVLAVYRVLCDALDACRSGGGPRLIEAITYRLGPPSTSDDPTRHRPEPEVAQWAHRDPLLRFEEYLRVSNLLDDAGAETVDEEIKLLIQEALAAVEGQPRPDRRTLFDDVFERLPWHLAEQREELLRVPARGPEA